MEKHLTKEDIEQIKKKHAAKTKAAEDGKTIKK
jgi:hypothetical protein